MKIKRRILLQAVEYAKNAAATDGAMDILKKILINVTPDLITIHGSDTKMTVISKIKAGFQASEGDVGKYLVDPNTFYQLLKELPASVDDINILFDKNITIKYNRSKVKLESFNGADNFPVSMEEKNVMKSVIVEGKKFAELIDAVCMVAVENKNAMLKAIHIVCEEGKLRSEASDGHTIAIAETEIQVDKKETFDFCIEGKSLKNASRMFKGKDIKLDLADKFIFISSDELLISVRQTEGKFPDFQQVINRFDGIGALAIPKEDFAGVLKRCILLKGSIQKPVALSTEDNILKFDIATDTSDLHEELEVFKNGENLEIKLDCRRLLECINVMPKEDETLNFYYSTNLSPIIMKNDDYLYCVLPIRG